MAELTCECNTPSTSQMVLAGVELLLKGPKKRNRFMSTQDDGRILLEKKASLEKNKPSFAILRWCQSSKSRMNFPVSH